MGAGRFTVRDLERGGTLVTHGDFCLQIGAYPETIKDTMTSAGVPAIYLIPEHMFDLQAGISAAELEFPLYYNYYVRRRKLHFVCTRPQLRPVLRVLSEALFGPRHTDLANEFLDEEDSPGFPNLRAEMDFFKREPSLPRGRLQLTNCLRPHLFDDHGVVEVQGTRIERQGGDQYLITREGDEVLVTYGRPLPKTEVGLQLETYRPPAFGITIIGSGHGFDVSANTSGFIIWIHGKGVMVDPPVNSTQWLDRHGINTRLIEDIILTHCHADHDSGTLQKILQEGRINLHTTETILRSFTRKYRAVTGLTLGEFQGLFNFSPLQIDQSVNILGAEFRFKYRLHPIPTIGFETYLEGSSFVYSSDTLYDPETILAMHHEGLMTKSRADDLLEFPWHHTLILHEAGVPPIHTPIELLAALPEDVKSRLLLTHVSSSAIPEASGLRLAPPGAANTIELQLTSSSDCGAAYRVLDLLAHIDLFRNLTVDKAAEFLRITRYAKHDCDEQIIRAGDPGDAFYMVLSGEADVIINGECIKTYGRYDYFGEIALIANQPRTADIVARSELELLSIGRYDFLVFIRGTRLPQLFRRVVHNRQSVAWSLFEGHTVLGLLTPYQRSQLQVILSPHEVRAGDTIFQRGERVYAYYLIATGEVELDDHKNPPVKLGAGTILGRIGRDLEIPSHGASARALTDTSLLQARSEEMIDFFRANPGFYLRLLQVFGNSDAEYLEPT